MLSLFCSHLWVRQERRLCRTSRGTNDRIMVWQLWLLTLLLGLVGTSVDMWPQRLDFCSKTELCHLVVDESSGVGYLEVVFCFRPNKSCHYTSNSPVCVSLKHISCDTMGECYFLWQQTELLGQLVWSIFIRSFPIHSVLCTYLEQWLESKLQEKREWKLEL